MTYESAARRYQAEQRYAWNIADAAFRRNLSYDQGQGSKSWQEQLAPFSQKLWETGVELVKANKDRQLNAAKEKDLYDGIDGVRIAGQENLDKDFNLWTEEEQKESFKSIERTRQLLDAGIPQHTAREQENTTLVDRQLQATKDVNKALTGVQAWVSNQMAVQLDPNTNEILPGLKLRKADGSIIDVTDENLSAADHAIAVRWLTAKYLENIPYKKEFLRSIDYYDNVGKIISGLQTDHLTRKNALADQTSEKRWTDYIFQNHDKLNADSLGAILNATQAFKNDKGKRFTAADSQEWLTDRIEDLADVAPEKALAAIKRMEENGYKVGNKVHKFGKQRILSLYEYVAKADSEQNTQDDNLRTLNESGLEKEHQARIESIKAKDISDEEKVQQIDALVPEFTQRWRTTMGRSDGVPAFLGNTKQKVKNTYEQDKYEVNAILSKQGNIIFEDQLIDRDSKLVNELRSKGSIIKGSLNSYIENLPAYKVAEKALRNDLSGVFGRTAYGAFKSGDGDLMLAEILKDLKRETLLEGKGLGEDGNQAVNNALVRIRTPLLAIKNIDEAKSTDWYKRFTGVDDTGSNVRNELSLLFEGKLKDADFNNLPDLTNDLVSLRLLPEDRQLEITRVGSSQIPIGTPLTNDIYKMYEKSLTRGELEVYSKLSKPELMAKLSEAAGLGKVNLSKEAVKEREILDSCAADDRINRLLAPELEKVRKYPNDRAHGINLYNKCVMYKMGGSFK
tara:strand:+ start:560 stop:2770 length:2211 start_codon:yes stop_codon:yes gene_type:complete